MATFVLVLESLSTTYPLEPPDEYSMALVVVLQYFYTLSISILVAVLQHLAG
jgi:hypothetical protein